MKQIRCTIYTRKSTEEGLDQAFNSLDAQRQAGLDYISSQKHEGWVPVETRYDNGGFSGGTLKRPALEALLADVARGRVDVVVVYKVDRLSRSLTDFARIMQIFDERGVSFVSVTQQFNTTNSMGRLTLNMLLSFAQFEREVAGERIRDKIAATKKQGYWVCGQPLLGCRLQRGYEPRGLYIVTEEAQLVREVFSRFSESRSLVGVAELLNSEGHTTKRWTSSAGPVHGGKPLNQKYIHGLLTNRVYIGKIRHRRANTEEVYKGRYEPIVHQQLLGYGPGRDQLTEPRPHSSLGASAPAQGQTAHSRRVRHEPDFNPAPGSRPGLSKSPTGSQARPLLHQPARAQARLSIMPDQVSQRKAPRRPRQGHGARSCGQRAS
ncbi:MAG: recombinase family protein [Planctomycetota bacterium]